MVSSRLGSLIVGAGIAASVGVCQAAPMKCPAPPAQVGKDITVETQAEVGKLGKLSGAELKNKTQVVAKNLLDKTPHSDRVTVAQMMMSFFCQFIAGSGLSDREKADRVTQFNEQILQLMDPSRRERPANRPNKPESAAPANGPLHIVLAGYDYLEQSLRIHITSSQSKSRVLLTGLLLVWNEAWSLASASVTKFEPLPVDVRAVPVNETRLYPFESPLLLSGEDFDSRAIPLAVPNSRSAGDTYVFTIGLQYLDLGAERRIVFLPLRLQATVRAKETYIDCFSWGPLRDKQLGDIRRADVSTHGTPVILKSSIKSAATEICSVDTPAGKARVALSHTRPDVRHRGVIVLRELASKGAATEDYADVFADILRVATSDAAPVIRHDAMLAAGEMLMAGKNLPQFRVDARTAEYVDLVTNRTKDNAAAVRVAAARRCAFFGTTAIPFLVPLLSDSDEEVRFAAAIAMTSITPKDPRIIPGLLDGLKIAAARGQLSILAQVEAETAFERIGAAAIAPLKDLKAATTDEHLKARIDWVLEKLGDR